MGAPQVTIETITVTRPLKVIAFTCCVLTVILMVAATSTADWMMAEGWREGLFMQCIEVGAPTPLPFDMADTPGCSKARSAGYLGLVAAFVIIGLITDFFGTFLTGLGLRSTDPNKKYKYYRVAIYTLVTSMIFLTLAAIIYPTSFAKDLAKAPQKDGGVVEPPLPGDNDFDNDGIVNFLDSDDDNDGIADIFDSDDDNDGISDSHEEDSDGDGVPDEIDADDNLEDDDYDNDGVPDDEDNDDDNDGVNDDEDDDDDNDGIADDEDNDDDNDGVTDEEESSEEDSEEDNDADNDGTDDDEDNDDDNDGIIDSEDNDDDGDGIPDSIDGARTFEFGFGYGATWGSICLIFASVVLLICDRESEEIFYKERQVEEEEEEESGEA